MRFPVWGFTTCNTKHRPHRRPVPAPKLSAGGGILSGKKSRMLSSRSVISQPHNAPRCAAHCRVRCSHCTIFSTVIPHDTSTHQQLNYNCRHAACVTSPSLVMGFRSRSVHNGPLFSVALESAVRGLSVVFRIKDAAVMTNAVPNPFLQTPKIRRPTKGERFTHTKQS